MRIRDDLLAVSEDMGTSGTKLYSLDYADLISGITLYIAATNGAGGNDNNPIERNISEIAIVDGSEVLWSLPGDVAYALFSQLHGGIANEYTTSAISDAPYVTIPIRFGRELYDPELGFVPSRFRNPQLKVTFDEATVTAAGASGFVSGTFALTINVHLVEEGPTPVGFLMAKDIYDFTTVGSGDEVIPMPVDYPWRFLMVRAYEAGVDMRSSVNNYKLNCDGGKFIPIDMSANALVGRMMEVFAETYKAGYANTTGVETHQTWIGIDTRAGGSAHDATRVFSMGSPWPGQVALSVYTDAGAGVSDGPLHWFVGGYAPHNLLLVPFGRINERGEWFQAQRYKKVNLHLTQDNEGAEVNVCVQQFRGY